MEGLRHKSRGNGGNRRYLREIFEVGEDIHVSEGVYSDDGTVSRSFLDVEQRVAELLAVRVQEVYRP